DRVGFSGAAFSDDLEMGALDRFGDLPARCVAASRAGCDLLFVCRRIEIYPDCVRAVELEVSSERRTEARRRLEEYAVRRDGLAAAAAPVNGSAALLLEAIERFRGELPIPS
ncbi:MAG TPA: hypothetical protein VIZ69_00175, partial [Thermoanaerobaculia bacterium]